MPKIIVVTGQTATGKTAYAEKLAQQINGEIVNCDSRQIYKNLDIVTGKDTTSSNYFEFNKIENFSVGYYILNNKKDYSTKLWLYDIIEPTVQFSAHDYAIISRQVITEIISRGKTPIVVGGTYMYLYYLLYVTKTADSPIDLEMRKKLSDKNTLELQQMLNNLDPITYNALNNSDKNNPHRLIRKIQLSLSGEPVDTHLTIPRAYVLSDLLHIQDLSVEYTGFRYVEKENLYKAIKKRVIERIEQNAVGELKNLLSKGYTMKNPGLNSIGYKDLFEYISGNISLERATENWIQKEMQYAKRQYTFMKKDPNIIWRFVDR